MKREVVQDFLNLPGIAGVALIDGRSRPVFYGIDQTLNLKQKEALAQGIQQVIETTPADFQFFQFQFIKHQVYIYKLDHGIILLVLTSNLLVYPSYRQAVDLLKAELQQDTSGAIATFRLLAGSITLSGQNYWQQRSGSAEPTLETEPPSISDSAAPSVSSLPPLRDLLIALNHLSQFTTHYLGTTVVTNYWKSSRPAIEWLDCFQIDRRSAHLACKTKFLDQPITPEQHQWIREWVAAFIDRCSKVIREFPLVIKQTALDEHQKNLLLPHDF